MKLPFTPVTVINIQLSSESICVAWCTRERSAGVRTSVLVGFEISFTWLAFDRRSDVNVHVFPVDWAVCLEEHVFLRWAWPDAFYQHTRGNQRLNQSTFVLWCLDSESWVKGRSEEGMKWRKNCLLFDKANIDET